MGGVVRISFAKYKQGAIRESTFALDTQTDVSVQEQTVEIASQVDHPSSAGLACLLWCLAALNYSIAIDTAGALVFITV